MRLFAQNTIKRFGKYLQSLTCDIRLLQSGVAPSAWSAHTVVSFPSGVHVLSYVLAGLALGSIYAIAAASLVVTYVASGIFSLAFAAMAFTVARVYYELNTEQHWSILPSAVVSLVIFAPALGMTLYWLLFKRLRRLPMLVKLMATMGLSVALPPLVELLLGRITSSTAPGLASRPLAIYHPFGALLNADQLVTYLGLGGLLVVGVGVLRFTDVGLKVR